MIFDQLPLEVFHFLIVFARIGAMVMVMPGVGEAYVPARIRLVLAIFLAMLITPTVAELLPTLPNTPFGLLWTMLPEIAIGLALGTFIRLVMLILQVAGAIIAMQSGLAFAQAFDPSQGTQSAIVGTFFSIMGVAIIFVAGLHHEMIMGMVGSYRLMPPMEPIPVNDLTDGFLTFLGEFFAFGFQLASPFIVVGLVFYIGIGLLNKLMPQVQVFFVAVPANILLGFSVLSLLLGTLMMAFLDKYDAFINRLLG